MNEQLQVPENGSIVVILAKNFDIPEQFKYHPRLVPLVADELPDRRDPLAALIPSNTQIVIVAGKIPVPIYGLLQGVFKRRSLKFLVRNNDVAIAEAISSILTPKANGTQVPVRLLPGTDTVALDQSPQPDETEGSEMAETKRGRKPGEVSQFIREHIDLGKGSAEEARRLHPLMARVGINSTVASIAQAISHMKRKEGRTETPKSIQSKEQRALTVLDDAIAGMTLVREWVAITEAENRDLLAKLEKFRQLSKALAAD